MALMLIFRLTFCSDALEWEWITARLGLNPDLQRTYMAMTTSKAGYDIAKWFKDRFSLYGNNYPAKPREAVIGHNILKSQF